MTSPSAIERNETTPYHAKCRHRSGRPLSFAAGWLLVLAALVLASCGPASNTPPPTALPPTAAPAFTPTLAPTATSTATHTPSPTPTPTSTPTPTPTPTPTHPLMIEVMRQQDYPGSEIVIEETLAPGSNYDRYLTTYLSEGLKIYALLTVPRGEMPAGGWPIIVFNHGYIPPEQYRTTERYVAYVDGFARSGYIVFRPDYRGHGFSEGQPSNAYGSTDYTVDVLNAMASVQRLPEADPDRVGMWGHSMGGTITLRAMVVLGDIKAGVIWAGVVAPYQELYERWQRRFAGSPTPSPDPAATPRPRWTDELLTFGTFEENPAFWASIDPTSHLDELSGPLQLHHGTGDTSVPVEYSEELALMLEAAGQVTELYLYPGDNHNISNSFGTAMQRSVAFFDRYVKGVEAE